MTLNLPLMITDRQRLVRIGLFLRGTGVAQVWPTDTADQGDAGQNDADAAEEPDRHLLTVGPADQYRDRRIDVGVSARLRRGDVAEQPVVGDEADQGANDEQVAESGRGARRDPLG